MVTNVFTSNPRLQGVDVLMLSLSFIISLGGRKNKKKNSTNVESISLVKGKRPELEKLRYLLNLAQ